ncbi:unnamed protein product [Fraxinus pennsylvanica]|uniref:Uncharacterized protein n=1 Tax=Fraxinus pennsylvanica TaxID=56036 RepID=A0AAD2E1Q6_9LAMI|nr:unnamed protein product [Fraxinus pennsylvanica]
MSSVSVGEGTVDKIEIMSDVAEVFVDNTAEVAAQAGPMVNKVATAAADSYFPVAALEYLTDYIHIIRIPEVKKFLGIPIIPVTPPSSTDQKPAFSFFEALKKYAAA